jgi:hypothetical protein
VESAKNANSQVKRYLTFCKNAHLSPKKGALRNATYKKQIRTIKRFMFWLNHVRHISCDFKGARCYVAAVIRWAGMNTNPLDTMPAAEARTLKQAYNKHAVIIHQPKIALPKAMLRRLMRYWCKTNSEEERTTRRESLLATATMLYVTLGSRAGNILLSTGPNKWKQVLLVGDVNSEKFDSRPSKKAPLFIVNTRMKNSKYPVISSVPFNSNTASPKRFCAATRLLELTRKRKRDGAGPDEALFVNPKSGGPLTTGVANSHLKKFLRKFCTKKGLPPRYSKLFSLKSFRKAVATEMQKRGASPQSIAKHLKHASIDSQMSYICKYHKQNQQLEKDLYKCITPPTAQSRDRKPKHT